MHVSNKPSKRLLKSIAFCALIVFTSGYSSEKAATEVLDYCVREKSKASAKKDLPPHRYSGSRAKTFYCKNNQQVKTTEIELLKGQHYRLIFDKAGLPIGQSVEVRIYDKPEDKKNRSLLWENTEDRDHFIFETKSIENFKYSTLYVEYFFPAYEKDDISSEVKKKGCVFLTIGSALR